MSNTSRWWLALAVAAYVALFFDPLLLFAQIVGAMSGCKVWR